MTTWVNYEHEWTRFPVAFQRKKWFDALPGGLKVRCKDAAVKRMAD
jgi:hypothetical protein